MTYYGYYLLGGSKLNLLLLISGIIIVVMIDLIHEKKRTVEKFIMEKFNTGIRWAFYIALTLILLFVIVRCYGQAASTFIYGKF